MLMGGQRSPIEVDLTGLTAPAIGGRGVSARQEAAWQKRITRYHRELVAARKAGELPFMDLPYDQDAVRRIRQVVRRLPKGTDNLVVLGIGGSALGTIALHRALHHPHHNELSAAERKGIPRLYVEDNIDPDRFIPLLQRLDLRRTVVNVVAKSGMTAETLALFLILRDRLVRKLGGPSAGRRIVVTTDPVNGPLRELAQSEGYLTLDTPAGVGGRFSVLTAVGLFPAAVTGIRIEDLLAGAAAMDRRCRSARLADNPAYRNALLHYLLDAKGVNIAVMLAYSHALRDLADWYRQLMAESLGKKFSTDRRVVHCGPTPVKGIGVTDQHSQFQLYLEGPPDKVITFLNVKRTRGDAVIPSRGVPEALRHLAGHRLSKIFKTEFEVARAAVRSQARRPSCTITLPETSAHAVGQLFYLLERQTAMAGKLYRINAFDQPGVTILRQMTDALLGRKGPAQERLRRRWKQWHR